MSTSLATRFFLSIIILLSAWSLSALMLVR